MHQLKRCAPSPGDGYMHIFEHLKPSYSAQRYVCRLQVLKFVCLFVVGLQRVA